MRPTNGHLETNEAIWRRLIHAILVPSVQGILEDQPPGINDIKEIGVSTSQLPCNGLPLQHLDSYYMLLPLHAQATIVGVLCRLVGPVVSHVDCIMGDATHHVRHVTDAVH